MTGERENWGKTRGTTLKRRETLQRQKIKKKNNSTKKKKIVAGIKRSSNEHESLSGPPKKKKKKKGFEWEAASMTGIWRRETIGAQFPARTGKATTIQLEREGSEYVTDQKKAKPGGSQDGGASMEIVAERENGGGKNGQKKNRAMNITGLIHQITKKPKKKEWGGVVKKNKEGTVCPREEKDKPKPRPALHRL